MKPEASQGKHIPVSIYLPQIPYRHARVLTGASGERGRRLTPCNIAGPQFCSGAGIFPSVHFVKTSPLHHSPSHPMFVVVFGAQPPSGPGTPLSWGFLDHTQLRDTVGRNPLDEWSARRRDLYLTKHNRETSMPPVGFEPTISADEQPQTYAWDRAATGTGPSNDYLPVFPCGKLTEESS
jgi:hypothetical protein